MAEFFFQQLQKVIFSKSVLLEIFLQNSMTEHILVQVESYSL